MWRTEWLGRVLGTRRDKKEKGDAVTGKESWRRRQVAAVTAGWLCRLGGWVV